MIWDEASPAWWPQIPAVTILHRVWLQQYVVMAGQLRLRAVADLPPARRRIGSPDARSATKRETNGPGYKGRVTESGDDHGAHLITAIQTTPTPVTDQAMAAPIQQALVDPGLAANEPLMDAGDVDAHLLVSHQRDHRIAVSGAVQPDSHW